MAEGSGRAVSLPMDWLATRLGSVDGHRVAISTPGGEVSYGELRHYVDSCAAILGDLRIGDVVGLRFGRSDPLAVLACLAVWQCGGVPLLQEAAASTAVRPRAMDSLGVTAELTRASVAVPRAIAVSPFDGAWLGFDQGADPTRNVNACVDPAYLIETSGSSGPPRASLNTAAGLSNASRAIVERYALDEDSRTLQFAPLNYDAWIADVVPALSTGARIVFGARGPWSRFGEINKLIEREQVTHLTAPPSVWRRVLPLRRPLAVAVAAGEALDIATARGMLLNAGRVINAYGPSETAICALTYEVQGSEDEIPLGTPIPHVSVSLSTAPGGGEDASIGLLRIYGSGVAHGYVGPENHPAAAHGWFGEDSNGSFFQTADRVRFTEGEVWFLGRADRAIKRGGRFVRLDRIESALRELPGIRECVVFERSSVIVCAYLPEPGGGIPAASDLEGVLERWEWPSAFEAVNNLPRTGSDKLDRRSLRETPDGSLPREEVDTLRYLWTDATGTESETESLFASGLDSLGAMELLDQVCEHFDVEIDIAELVESPTLVGLLQLLRQARAW